MDRVQEVGLVPRGPLTQAIKNEIEASLVNKIPPGKRGALLVITDKHGVKFEVTANLDKDGNWKLHGNAGTTWGGDVSGSVVLAGSW